MPILIAKQAKIGLVRGRVAEHVEVLMADNADDGVCLLRLPGCGDLAHPALLHGLMAPLLPTVL